MSEVFEHEIPAGSRLYFGASAALKRKLEDISSKILIQAGFNEMVTPFFSYHQQISVNPQTLLRFSDRDNYELSLRADSTVDVVRIVMRRLKEQGRWFYIQPVFRYPSHELYQIGAESIGKNEIKEHVSLVLKIFDEVGLDGATLQLSHIGIPLEICSILGLDIELFNDGRIQELFGLDVPWLNQLIKASSPDDLSVIDMPQSLRVLVDELVDMAKSFKNTNLKVEPLFYSRMRYYEGLFFCILDQKSILASGGEYEIDEAVCSGFAIYSDAVLEKLSLKEAK